MTPAERLRLPLRLAVIVSGLSGLLALGTASLLSIPAVIAVAVCFLAGSAASVWLSSAEEARLRRGASIAVLLMVGGYAGHSALAGLGQDPLVAIGPVLALLLCGLQVAHALVLNVRRDLLVGLTIGLFMTVLAAGLAPGPSVAAPLLIGWPVAVTALVLAQRLERLESGQLVAAPAGRSDRTRGSLAASTAKTVGISIVAGLIVFLLLPQPTGLSARSRLLGADAPIDSSGEVRGTDYYSSGVMDLRTRGSLSDAPVIDVPGDSPELWRGAVLSTYDGQTWYARSESLGFLNQSSTLTLPHPFDALPATADRTDTVRLLAGFTGSIVTPGVAESITVDGGVNVSADGALALSWTQTPPATYTVTSRPEVVDPTVLKSSTGTEPTDDRWLQLPQTLPQRVRDLAGTLTRGLPSRYAQVRAVETYLRLARGLPARLAPPGGRRRRRRRLPVHLARRLLRAVRVGRGRPAQGSGHPGPARHRPGVRDPARRREPPDAGVERACVGRGLVPGGGVVDVRPDGGLASREQQRAVVAVAADPPDAGLRRQPGRRRRDRGRRCAGPRAGAPRGPQPPEAPARPPRGTAPSGPGARCVPPAGGDARRDRSGEAPRREHRRAAREAPRAGSAALHTLERECYGGSPPSAQESATAADTLDDLARTLAEVTRQ